ncbi:hypothetical protein [Microbispora sp. CA-102843]|uniref:hypothetical protein n=1 Tax=Microbispora sp. CA-102843 TaxID=3239952 RepID=UPI003D8DE807
MRDLVARIGRDIKSGKNIEAYVVIVLSFFFAVSSIVGDIIPLNLRWAALLGGIGLLIYKTTVPSAASIVDSVLHDRTSFDSIPFSQRVARAREVWIYAPSGINLLSPQNCDAIRTNVLSRRDGSVRILVLDPDKSEEVDLAARQLDGSVEYPLQNLHTSLSTITQSLYNMGAWIINGDFQHRYAGYNPGFSLIVIDPSLRHGYVIVEFHGYHNETTSRRMHLVIAKAESEKWFSYWLAQFEHMWAAARVPEGRTAD